MNEDNAKDKKKSPNQKNEDNTEDKKKSLNQMNEDNAKDIKLKINPNKMNWIASWQYRKEIPRKFIKNQSKLVLNWSENDDKKQANAWMNDAIINDNTDFIQFLYEDQMYKLDFYGIDRQKYTLPILFDKVMFSSKYLLSCGTDNK